MMYHDRGAPRQYFKILLPIQIQEVVNDYIFSFQLTRVTTRPCKRHEALNSGV
jgi:hypothetical protein